MNEKSNESERFATLFCSITDNDQLFIESLIKMLTALYIKSRNS